MNITIYTDGSCLRNGQENPSAGCAAIMICDKGAKEFSGKLNVKNPTNNVAELMAVIAAVSKLKKGVKADVQILSDSKYVIGAFTEGWLNYWRSHNWNTSSNKPCANAALWQRLDKLLIEYGETYSFGFNYVQGHSENEYNNRCDKLAKAAAAL